MNIRKKISIQCKKCDKNNKKQFRFKDQEWELPIGATEILALSSQVVSSIPFVLLAHWSVIECRTRKQDIELGNYTTQNLENMADLHGES